MKISCISDLHLWRYTPWCGPLTQGLSRREHEQLRTLTLAMQAARGTHCLIAGDLFNGVKPDPQLLAATREVLRHNDVTIIVGNHDQVSDAQNDHALGPLAWPDGVEIVEAPKVLALGEGPHHHEVLLVPFRRGSPSQWLPHLLETHLAGGGDDGQGRTPASFRCPTTRILLLHCGIRDSKTPSFLSKAENSIDVALLFALCKKYHIDVVFSGDWHQHRVWSQDSTWICQVGSLIPHDFTDVGLEPYGKVVFFDTSTQTLETKTIPGPRFFNIKNEDEAYAAAVNCKAQGHSAYIHWTTPPEKVTHAVLTLNALVKAGDIVAGEAWPDDSEVKRASEAAARSARQAISFEEAMTTYVMTRKFSGEVKNERVLERVRGFMKE